MGSSKLQIGASQARPHNLKDKLNDKVAQQELMNDSVNYGS